MAIDDNPTEVRRRQEQQDATAADPFAGKILAALRSIPDTLFPWPLNKVLDRLQDAIEVGEIKRIALAIAVCEDEVLRHDQELQRLASKLDEQASEARSKTSSELLIDAVRRASITRSLERVKRIGIILGNGLLAEEIDGDETEEMMRIAMELTDQDVVYLRELVRIEGERLRTIPRIERYDAHTRWEGGSWGTMLDAEADSAFSKLESYGLVSRIAPPNNLNITADFQSRYVLLQKGLRFFDAITSKAG